MESKRPPKDCSGYSSDNGLKSGIFDMIEKDVMKIIDNAEKFAKESRFPVFDNTMQL